MLQFLTVVTLDLLVEQLSQLIGLPVVNKDTLIVALQAAENSV